MGDVMVTGRMSQEKKQAGNEVLERAGLNASQAINMLYDLLIQRQDVEFLRDEKPLPTKAEWRAARDFLDEMVLPSSVPERFETMSAAEIRYERLAAKELAR